MNFDELENLRKDSRTNLFDLSKAVFVFDETVPLFPYFVEREAEMRMDIISDNLYETTDYVAFLCRLNNIVNPLNIKENTLLVYPNRGDILRFKPEEVEFIEEVKEAFLNINKNKRVDKNREKYLNSENDIILPPNFNQTNSSNIELDDDGVITISSNF